MYFMVQVKGDYVYSKGSVNLQFSHFYYYCYCFFEPVISIFLLYLCIYLFVFWWVGA